MTDHTTLVQGNVVTPTEVIVGGGVLHQNGKIVQILTAAEAAERKSQESVQHIDAAGKYILPGGIDPHVHSFSDPREGFQAATKSAAAGGITTIIDMPYDDGKPVNNIPRVHEKIAEIPGNAYVDVALHGTLAPGSFGKELPEMVGAGICGFKVSMFETDPNRFPRISNDELFEILKTARKNNVVVGVHAEDGEIIGSLIDQFTAEGNLSPIYHCKSRPPVSETVSIAAGIAIAEAAQSAFHIFHASLPESIDLVVKARERGVDVSAETCPHYLLFSEEDMDRLGARGKINPPLRSRDRVERLWEQLELGHIDMLSSDHAPWRLDKKSDADNIFKNSSGAPGVQLIYALLLSEGYSKGRLSLHRVVQLMASGPANRFNLGHRKGQIAVGYDADLAIFDPTLRWVVDAQTQHSLAGWTPYEGIEMVGKIVETYVRGTLVATQEKLVGSAEVGQYIRGENGSVI